VHGVIEVETPRLLLRQWKAADRRAFAALNADPIVMAHFPAPLTREQSDATANRLEGLIAERGWGVWACEWMTRRLNIPASLVAMRFEHTATIVYRGTGGFRRCPSVPVSKSMRMS
jgi:RimJ/RimL family protein N-acetyltransferase